MMPRRRFENGFPKRRDFKSMTVCIAAACEGGKKCVTATDGLLSYGGVTADVLPSKELWKIGERDQWQFMYAGDTSKAAMAFEELDHILIANPDALSRANIQTSVSEAFQHMLSRASSFGVLAPFDISLEEFKAEGVKMFGESQFSKMAEQIHRNAHEMTDQILVVGWGHAEASVMIYSVSPWGEDSHKFHGFSAIGSGAEVALSELLLLGQSRNSTLADTIYNVAAAKFSAEHSQGLGVGRSTSMYVTRKRTETDPKGKKVGDWILDADLDYLIKLWKEHPRVPPEAIREAVRISARINGGTISVREMVAAVNASIKQSEPET